MASSTSSHQSSTLLFLARYNAIYLAFVGGLLGLLALSGEAALLLCVSGGAYALSSKYFAALSIHGRVATATAIRNLAWLVATITVAGLSMLNNVSSVWTWALPFTGAIVLVLIVYRRITPEIPHIKVVGRISNDTAWRTHKTAVMDVVGCSAAQGIGISIDRIGLAQLGDGKALGEYVAQGDLAIKMNVIGTAISQVLYPLAARDIIRTGIEAAGRKFSSVACYIMSGWFLVIATLTFFEREVIQVVLGSEYLAGHYVYRYLLLGVFVNQLGYLLTPWQRARGEFSAQRKAYGWAAILMCIVAPIGIPFFGLYGAVAVYLTGRIAELLLLTYELGDRASSAISRIHVWAFMSMLLTLALIPHMRSWSAAL